MDPVDRQVEVRVPRVGVEHHQRLVLREPQLPQHPVRQRPPLLPPELVPRGRRQDDVEDRLFDTRALARRRLHLEVREVGIDARQVSKLQPLGRLRMRPGRAVEQVMPQPPKRPPGADLADHRRALGSPRALTRPARRSWPAPSRAPAR